MTTEHESAWAQYVVALQLRNAAANHDALLKVVRRLKR